MEGFYDKLRGCLVNDPSCEVNFQTCKGRSWDLGRSCNGNALDILSKDEKKKEKKRKIIN